MKKIRILKTMIIKYFSNFYSYYWMYKPKARHKWAFFQKIPFFENVIYWKKWLFWFFWFIRINTLSIQYLLSFIKITPQYFLHAEIYPWMTLKAFYGFTTIRTFSMSIVLNCELTYRTVLPNGYNVHDKTFWANSNFNRTIGVDCVLIEFRNSI